MAAGGLLGSAARAGVGRWFEAGGFPVAILIVNLVGSFLLGFFLARRERAVSGEGVVRFWAIGALGSFTTFSAFSADLVLLVDGGEALTAAWYLLASVVGGLWSAIVGLRLGQ